MPDPTHNGSSPESTETKYRNPDSAVVLGAMQLLETYPGSPFDKLAAVCSYVDERVRSGEYRPDVSAYGRTPELNERLEQEAYRTIRYLASRGWVLRADPPLEPYPLAQFNVFGLTHILDAIAEVTTEQLEAAEIADGIPVDYFKRVLEQIHKYATGEVVPQ